MAESFVGQYCIVRTRDAGVHAGVIVLADKDSVIMAGARRLWYWSGAASLSELSVRGVMRPTECKFPIAVEKLVLPAGVIEIIPATAAARASIEEVPEWHA